MIHLNGKTAVCEFLLYVCVFSVHHPVCLALRTQPNDDCWLEYARPMGRVIISNLHVVIQGQSSRLWRTGPDFVVITEWWWCVGECGSLNRLLLPREFCPSPSPNPWFGIRIRVYNFGRNLIKGLPYEWIKKYCPDSGTGNLRMYPNL